MSNEKVSKRHTRDLHVKMHQFSGIRICYLSITFIFLNYTCSKPVYFSYEMYMMWLRCKDPSYIGYIAS